MVPTVTGVGTRRAARRAAKLCRLPCPKCESADVNLHYHRAKERSHSGAGSSLKYLPVDSDLVRVEVDWQGATSVETRRECLLHWCRTCQYNWWTPVADAEHQEMLDRLKTL